MKRVTSQDWPFSSPAIDDKLEAPLNLLQLMPSQMTNMPLDSPTRCPGLRPDTQCPRSTTHLALRACAGHITLILIQLVGRDLRTAETLARVLCSGD